MRAKAQPFQLLGVLALLCLAFVWLVPLGSTPVGFDSWWSLFLGKTLASHGFPARIPAAGWTMYAEAFADKHLLLSSLIALIGGENLGPNLASPLVWGLVLAQALGLFWALRILLPKASPLWLLLLPALSSTWVFRSTTLRDLPLALSFLTPLLASLVRDAEIPPKGDTHSLIGPAPENRLPGGRPLGGAVSPLWRTPLLSLCFCFSHGAWLLPLVCAFFVGLGTRLHRGRFSWRPLLLLLLAWIPALFLRPDFPANLRLLGLMNFGMPWAILRGDMQILPTEFLPYSFADLLYWNAPLLLTGLALLPLAKAKRIPLALLLPVLFILLTGLLSRRLLEVASPVVLLALAVSWKPKLPLGVLAIALPLALIQITNAAPSVAANRYPSLHKVASWLRAHGQRGDVVWVSDWGISSPLIYGTATKGLVFTGVMDPTLMWAQDREAWRAWQEVKLGRSRDPLGLLEKTFHPRFLVLPLREAPPGQEPGSTAAALYRGLQALQNKGVPLQTTAGPIGGRWLCYRIGW